MWQQWAVDFYRVSLRLIAWFYRAPIFSAILQSNADAMNYINLQFVNYKNAVDYKLSFNAQIVYLEKFLNNMFNIPYAPATRDADIANHIIIWIDSPNKYPNYLWNKVEGRPPVFLYNKAENKPALIVGNLSEYQASNAYTINIPASVTYVELIVRNAVNTYNLASKRFTIQTY